MDIPIPIDIKLPDAIAKAMTPPSCDDLKVPSPQKLSLCLPFGGSFQSITDVSKGIPDDCEVTFSILLQLQPLMGSLGCFIKLLKVIQPLVDIITGLTHLPAPDLGKVAGAMPKFVEAAADIASCFLAFQTSIPKFVRDLLHMIAKLLKCIAGTIKSIAELMSGLEISIQSAQASGNKALMDQLKCAKDNAQSQADAAMGSMDMIAAVLSVAEPLLAIAGITPTLPTIGSAQDAAALEEAANTMLSIGTSLDQLASTLDFMGQC
ncbi:MAG: hypothetical protein ABJE66_04610 [Deltaproteobacteria bacterium]